MKKWLALGLCLIMGVSQAAIYMHVDENGDTVYSDTNENNCDLYKDFFKNMSKNDYALEIWRNEWMECFIPSTGKSTLVLSPEGYSISGSIFLDRIVLSILIFGCFVFAVFLWRQSDELKWE